MLGLDNNIIYFWLNFGTNMKTTGIFIFLSLKKTAGAFLRDSWERRSSWKRQTIKIKILVPLQLIDLYLDLDTCKADILLRLIDLDFILCMCMDGKLIYL